MQQKNLEQGGAGDISGGGSALIQGGGDPTNQNLNQGTPPAPGPTGEGSPPVASTMPTPPESLPDDPIKLKELLTAANGQIASIPQLNKTIKDMERANSKMGNKLNTWSTIEQGFKMNPEGTLKALAERFNVKLPEEKPLGASGEQGDSNLNDLLDRLHKGEDVGKEIGEALTKRDHAVVAQAVGQVNPILKAIQEEGLHKKYPDYDDHAEARAELNLRVKARVMSEDERDHLAVRGLVMPQALNESFDRGYQKALDDVSRKNAAGLGGGGGSGKPEPKPGDEPKKPQTWDDVRAKIVAGRY